MIDLDGLTLLINQSVDLSSISLGATTELSSPEQEEMVKLYSATSLIEPFPGLTSRQFSIKRTKFQSMIAFTK